MKKKFKNEMNKNLRSKKAWMRVIEAFLSIMVIASAILVINSVKTQNVDISDFVIDKQKQILNIIGNDNNYRSGIISGDLSEVNGFITKNIPNSWDFLINLCDINEICNQGIPSDKSVYISETIITANLNDYPDEVPKKLRLNVWVK